MNPDPFALVMRISTNNEPENRNTFTLSSKFVFFALIEAPLLYLVILYLLEQAGAENGAIQGEEYPLPLITFLMIVMCVFMNVALYKFFIPHVLEPSKRTAKKMDDTLGSSILILACGAVAPGAIGLLIGMLEYTSSGTISWFLELPFILFGFLHGIVLYKYQINVPQKQ